MYLAYSENGQQYISTDVTYEAGRQYIGRTNTSNTPAAPKPGEPAASAGIKALDPETGKTMWSFKIFQGSLTNGVLATAGNVVLAAVRDGNLVALDGKTGKHLWHVQTGGNMAASPNELRDQRSAVRRDRGWQRRPRLCASGCTVMTRYLRGSAISARMTLFRAALAVLGLVSCGTAWAQPYSARRTGDVVQLEDTRSQTVVSILPSVGNIAFSMKVKGHEVLRWPYESVEQFKSRPGLSGIPFVGPWANRLDEQAFYANGKRYPFDMELGNVRGAIPIHGFLTTNDKWQIVEVKSDNTSAWVLSRLEFFRQPAWMKQWPFAHTVEVMYRLKNGELEVHTAITNASAEPMPVAIGFHPYFQLTDSPRSTWKFSLAAKTHWLLAPNKVPTGETESSDVLFPNRRSAVLEDYNLDDVFSDLERDGQGRATMTVAGKAQRLDVALGPNFRSVVVWAPHPENRGRGSQSLGATAPAAGRGNAGQTQQDRNFICIEPMAGITDAVNLAQKGRYSELQSIPAGGTWQESFWIRPSGF